MQRGGKDETSCIFRSTCRMPFLMFLRSKNFTMWYFLLIFLSRSECLRSCTPRLGSGEDRETKRESRGREVDTGRERARERVREITSESERERERHVPRMHTDKAAPRTGPHHDFLVQRLETRLMLLLDLCGHVALEQPLDASYLLLDRRALLGPGLAALPRLFATSAPRGSALPAARAPAGLEGRRFDPQACVRGPRASAGGQRWSHRYTCVIYLFRDRAPKICDARRRQWRQRRR